MRSSTAIDDDQDLFGDEIVTLISDSDSDSFEGFENLDFSGLKLPTSTPAGYAKGSSNTPKPQTFGPARPSQIRSPAPAAHRNLWVDKLPFPAKPWRPAKATLSPKLLIPIGIVSLVLAISVLGYFGIRFFFSAQPVVVKTELQRSAIGLAHSKNLFQFKKAERVLSNLERGYLQKRMPEAGLSDVRAVKLKADALIEEDAKKMKEANDLYTAGNMEAAQAILQMQIDAMNTLQKEVEFQTKWLERKVFPR